MTCSLRFLACFLVLSTVAYSQDFKNTDLQGLINAEREFAKMSKDASTRDAFYNYLADDGITFAEKPRIGKDHLETAKSNTTWLHWYPVYTDISASGDFGFNTGPWEFRKSREEAEPVAFGQFISVWKKVDGVWRVAIDLGIGHDKPVQKETLHTSMKPLKKSSVKTDKQTTEILAEEKNFITALGAGKDVYTFYFSKEARLYRNGAEPFTSPEAIRKWVKANPGKEKFSPVDAQVSSARDMAFVYGTGSTDVIEDGKTVEHTANYMHIWKKEDGKHWKIVVEVFAVN